MSYVSAQAKVYADSRSREPICKLRRNRSAWDYDEEESSFGGKGCLTKEQFERGMALTKKMRKMSEW